MYRALTVVWPSNHHFHSFRSIRLFGRFCTPGPFQWKYPKIRETETVLETGKILVLPFKENLSSEVIFANLFSEPVTGSLSPCSCISQFQLERACTCHFRA